MFKLPENKDRCRPCVLAIATAVVLSNQPSDQTDKRHNPLCGASGDIDCAMIPCCRTVCCRDVRVRCCLTDNCHMVD